MELILNIDDEVKKKFDIALMLSGDNSCEVLTKLMRDYAKSVFAREAGDYTFQQTDEIESSPVRTSKAVKRIPIWARRPNQFNHRILKAFFDCEDKNGYVTKDALRDHFMLHTDNPGESIWKFDSNFNSMLTEAGNSNGKVFECTGELISLDKLVEPTAREYKSFFKNLDK